MEKFLEKYLDPQFWKSSLVAVSNEPVLIPLIVLTFLGTWWFRGSIVKGQIAGLETQVGLRIVLSEDCSAFTRVTACTLALSPYIVTR